MVLSVALNPVLMRPKGAVLVSLLKLNVSVLDVLNIYERIMCCRIEVQRRQARVVVTAIRGLLMPVTRSGVEKAMSMGKVRSYGHVRYHWAIRSYLLCH